MSKTLIFEAQAKKESGKSAAKHFRQNGMVPAIIYGGKNQGAMVGLPFNQLVKESQRGDINFKLAEIKLDNESITTIIRSVQMHPVTDMPLHVDLQEVAGDQLIKVRVRLKVEGEERCAAIKRGGVLNLSNRYIELFCKASAIPTYVEVDVSELAINHSVHVNELTLPEGSRPFDRSNFVVISLSGKSEEKEESAAASPK